MSELHWNMLILVSLLALYIYFNLRSPRIEVGPRSKIDGSNARNGLTQIFVADDLGRDMSPILGQEERERRLKVLWFPVYLVFFILRKVPLLKNFWAMFKRWIEYHGHEVEVQGANVEYGENMKRRRNSEATVMANNYWQFEGYEVSEIEKRMEKVSSKSRKWYLRNQSKLHKLLRLTNV